MSRRRALPAVLSPSRSSAACGGGSGAVDPRRARRQRHRRPRAATGGTLTVALAADPDELDPTLAQTLVGRKVFAGMCEKLYDIDEELQLVPQLAARCPTSATAARPSPSSCARA